MSHAQGDNSINNGRFDNLRPIWIAVSQYGTELCEPTTIHSADMEGRWYEFYTRNSYSLRRVA